MIFEGSGVAIITPFNDDGSVDTEGYAELVQFHLDNGTDALIVCGTTGEATTMNEDEKIDLIKQTQDIVGGQIPIIAGTGNNNTQATIDFSKKVDQLGIDGLLVVTPYYNKSTRKGLYEHFRVIAEAVETPIIMYNVPGRTNVTIPVETVAALAEIDNIVGIKDATADLGYTAEVRGAVSDDFAIYSGNDDVVVPLMSLGGNGVISVSANVLPQETHDMVQAALDGDFAKAADLQIRLMPVIRSFFVEVNPVPVKAAVNIINKPGGKLRLPLYEAEDTTKKLIRAALDQFQADKQ